MYIYIPFNTLYLKVRFSMDEYITKDGKYHAGESRGYLLGSILDTHVY